MPAPSRVKSGAQQAPKGPFWELLSSVYVGRIVRHKSDGRSGYVAFGPWLVGTIWVRPSWRHAPLGPCRNQPVLSTL